MALEWGEGRSAKLAKIFGEFPAESHRCETAAAKALPITREEDEGARLRKLLPSEGRFVLPKKPVGEPWRHHIMVETRAHYLDSITGPPGERTEEYLESHWQYPDAIDIVDVEGEGP